MVPERSGGVTGVSGHVLDDLKPPGSAYKIFSEIGFLTSKTIFSAFESTFGAKKLFLGQKQKLTCPRDMLL